MPPVSSAADSLPLCRRRLQVRLEWNLGRTTKQVNDDICDFWFGTNASRTRGKKQPHYGAKQAASHIKEALEWCDWWIANMGHRCSGTLADLTYDESKVYEDDGSLLGIISNNGAVVADDGDEADDGDLVGGDDAPGADWDDEEE